MFAANSIKNEAESLEDDKKQKLFLEELKKSNETTTAFGFDGEDCEYTIITSDKNIKFTKHFLQYVCDDSSSFPKEIDLSEVPGEDVIAILALYLPRTENSRGKDCSWINSIYKSLHYETRALYKVCFIDFSGLIIALILFTALNIV